MKCIFVHNKKWRLPEKLIDYILTALNLDENTVQYKREDYAIRQEIVVKIEDGFGKQSERDCFANPKNAIQAGPRSPDSMAD